MIEGPVFFEPATRADRFGREELEALVSELGALVKSHLAAKYGPIPRVAPVVMVTCGTLNAIESSHLGEEPLAALLLLNAFGIRMGLAQVTGADDEAMH